LIFNNKKKTIYIDFDGVLNNYNGWLGEENLSTPKSGVEDFLKKLSENYEIYIFTARNSLYVINWLVKYNLKQDISTVTNIKSPAYAYIDDRAIKFDGDYSKIFTEQEDFKPHWM
jgi:hypothetical protein